MVIVITGASSGIGAAAAVELTRRGIDVLATGRSSSKLHAVHERMVAVAPSRDLVRPPIQANLASLAGVAALAAAVLKQCGSLEALVNNAAVQPYRRTLSPDRHELNLAVNHLAPFLLTHLLLDRLVRSGGCVVSTASSTHHKGRFDFDDIEMRQNWSSQGAYGTSKLGNILFTAELQRRAQIPASCFHPGNIWTDINRESPWSRVSRPVERMVFSAPERGARTLVWLVTSPEGGKPSAIYYEKMAPAQPSAAAHDPVLAARLWSASMQMVHQYA